MRPAGLSLRVRGRADDVPLCRPSPAAELIQAAAADAFLLGDARQKASDMRQYQFAASECSHVVAVRQREEGRAR